MDTIMKMTYFMFLGMLSPNQADTQLYLLRFSQKTQVQDGRRKNWLLRKYTCNGQNTMIFISIARFWGSTKSIDILPVIFVKYFISRESKIQDGRRKNLIFDKSRAITVRIPLF